MQLFMYKDSKLSSITLELHDIQNRATKNKQKLININLINKNLCHRPRPFCCPCVFLAKVFTTAKTASFRTSISRHLIAEPVSMALLKRQLQRDYPLDVAILHWMLHKIYRVSNSLRNSNKSKSSMLIIDNLMSVFPNLLHH